MAEKANMSRQESALVNILERMSAQLQNQEQMLEVVAQRQHELAKAVETAHLLVISQQSNSELAIEKLHESFSRYRSDMLSLVNEQDHINKNMAGLSSHINKTTYALEKSNQLLAGLEEHIKSQEKTINEHYTHSLKQAEALPKLISDSNRSVTRLHMDTEKNLGKLHQETQHQLEKLQQETTRRLLVLGDIESALQTLLIRTEPPEKKPFWLVYLLRKAALFCRTRLSRLSKITWRWKKR